MSRIVFILFLLCISTDLYSQAWAMHEAAEDRSNPISALIGFFILLGICYVLKKISEAYKKSQEPKRRKQIERDLEFRKNEREIKLRKTAVFQSVDLGLSVKWATFNLGAYKPSDLGSEFIWSKKTPGGAGSKSVDNLNTLGDISANKEYDAAAYILGDKWRMPTVDECRELIDKCNWELAVIDNVTGYNVIGPNGNKIFLPYTDSVTNKYNKVFNYGIYWTSCPSFDSDWPKEAQDLRFGDICEGKAQIYKSTGLCRLHHIRPVYGVINTVSEDERLIELKNVSDDISSKNMTMSEEDFEFYKNAVCIKEEEKGIWGLNEKNTFKDEYGVLYSVDKKRLLYAGDYKDSVCKIKEGTEFICENAFHNRNLYVSGKAPQYIKKIILPKSLLYIHSSALPKNCEIESHTPCYTFIQDMLIDLRTRSVVKCVNEFVQEVIVPDNIHIIGERAFSYCECLSTVVLPDSLIVIRSDAFRGCKVLQSVNLPDSVSSIENSAFWGCNNLNVNHLPKGLKTLGDYVFEGCGYLTNIVIPSSIKHVGKHPLGSNVAKVESLSSRFVVKESLLIDIYTKTLIQVVEKVDEVKIPSDIEIIGVSALEDSNISSITIPSTVKEIEKGAFSFCKRLLQANINSNLEILKSSIFFNCENLSEVKLPQSLLHIEDTVFHGCKSLARIELPESLISIGRGAFGFCDSLDRIVIPQNIKKLGVNGSSCYNDNGVFYYCKSLNTVTLMARELEQFDLPKETQNRLLGEKVMVLPTNFFRDINVEKIVVPANIRRVKSDAFRNCIWLREITFLSEFVEFEENWLRECKGVKVIYLNRKALERIKDKMFCPNTIEIKEHKGLFGKIFG